MDEYLGIIKIFAGNFAPRGWMMCNGQILSIAQNTALFSLLGTTYGGNGQTTFALPNLQSRVPVGMGQGPGLSMYVQGQLGGTENTTLTLSNMPAHNHQVVGNLSVKANANAANTDTPEGAYMGPSSAQIYNDAAAGSFMAADTVSINLPTTISGSNIPFNNLSPYIAMNYIICVSGIYPSRN